MINLDQKDKRKIELEQKLQAAISGGDEKEMAQALLTFANSIQENILAEYRSMSDEARNDTKILAARGVQQLTVDEHKYYTQVIEGHGFENAEQLVPPTVINRVFEDLVREHPLLSHIDFHNVGAALKWIMNKGEVPTAWWGKLTSEIKEILDDGFEVVNTDLFKLSAFIPVHNSMLDLGPEWLDKYVRTVLVEAMAIGLEDGVVSGTGVQSPVGMIRDLSVFNNTSGHPEKTAVALTDLSPTTLGANVMSPLTKSGKRKVNNVLMVVNPIDYWERIFPATTMLTISGAYVSGILPIPATVVQSVSMPKGKMIAGIGKDYFLGAGSEQKIKTSDEYRFIEDQSVYLIRQYANGRPKNADSFLLFDISGLTPSLKA